MFHIMIMAGGKGTRFWPLSRAIKAKQFLTLIGNTSLIEQTIHRIQSFVPKKQRWVLGNQAQATYLNPLTKFIPAAQILKEPIGKNTAACIGWGAIEAYKKDKNAVLAILPSDHYIKNTKAFAATLKQAQQEAEKNNTIVTIGIPPNQPHTGYGYIETSKPNDPILNVKAFHEKPTLKKATSYINKGTFYWNAGMFICRADILLSLISTHMPKHHCLLKELEKAQTTKEINTIYTKFEPISIDYGIMEKATENTRLIPATFDWNDIGNWRAVENLLKQDVHQNAEKAHTLHIDSKNNIIYSETNRLIATAHLNDMIIIDTSDALLVLPKKHDQAIKKIYEKLPNKLQ